MRDVRKWRCRGAFPVQTMFLLAGVLLVVAVAILLLVRREEEKVEEQKAEVMGKAGVRSTFTLRRTEGINLPIADRGESGEMPAERTVEIPIEWGKDPAGAEQKLAERFQAIAEKLKGGEGAMVLDEAAVIRIDRDLEYRTLVQAVLEGRKVGFVRFHIVCLKKGGEPEAGFLQITLPTGLPKRLLFRMVKEEQEVVYVLGSGREPRYSTLAGAMRNLQKLADRQPDAILEFMPSLELSVQNVVEGLNAASSAGFKSITFSRPPKLY